LKAASGLTLPLFACCPHLCPEPQFNYLSAFKYALESMTVNLREYTDDPVAAEYLNVVFEVDGVSKWRGIGVLALFTVFYRIVFWLLLRSQHTGLR
jgi:hypothetical protein